MIRTRVALIEITEEFISCSVTVLLVSEALLAAISGPQQYEGKQQQSNSYRYKNRSVYISISVSAW